MSIFNVIDETKLIPLTTITSREDVEPLCEVLVEASIPLIEITLRDKRTLDIIDEFNKFPEVYLGVGTIRSKSHIDLAVNASASFLITPGYSENLLDYAKQKNIPLIPGVQTPSEIMKANEAGLSTLKFFPAELSGGVDRLKAYKSVFSDIKFIPTGGITNGNALSYLALDNVMAVGASALISPDLVNSKSWSEIKNNLKESKELITKS
ncbi:MAG: bifunctional 4-hydroxy-2-oxoglutarate aldolase/2-dehydro-3-deoxy-phosphogluconate aldolase [Proteobacteria bacterium]|nr:bifunctional 4-hydroxy-2-oxoglutarate aldolase/2-dehydro-3-deoxy-phosphogluconate aldolase [Pseudomonadota bacterium]